jgi:hypothetical protein
MNYASPPPASPPPARVRIVALTYEWNGVHWQLVVKHEFYGPTRESAEAVYQAHLRADAFLRGCTEAHGYSGIGCRTETYIEGLS